ncbi:MAG: amino acid permease [Scytolyngbya sp. HA4215-MV1]|jgi:PAS domain S-box-containing protein|nr:amino acid permease [Scytolyngbya sp. HA4215-MV1]
MNAGTRVKPVNEMLVQVNHISPEAVLPVTAKHSSPFRLQPSLSALETWGFGFSGLLLWLGPAPAMHAALGTQAIFVWVPGAIVGILLNLQVKRLGQHWQTIAGGTPNYTARLLESYPWLAAYSAIGYFFGWAAVPLVNAIILTDLIKANLTVLGIACPEILLKLGFTVLAFIVALSGTRALGILHLFFIIPAIGFLLTFCIQGLGWLSLAAESPGLLPTYWAPFEWVKWAKWFFIAVYAVYACETASSFVADSRRPTATLKCLSVTAWSIPIVYLGGSWVLMRLGSQEAGDNAFLNLLTAAQPFWGESASLLVTFLIASACLLSCATGFSNSPRILYQLALDGYLSPVFAVVSRRGVLGPALIFTLLMSLVAVVWGDVSRVVMVTGTGYFASIVATHLGLWLQRHQPQVWLPRWSFAFFVIEGVVLVVGGIAWDWIDFIVGLLIPAGLLAIDQGIRRVPLSWCHPDWWERHYRTPAKEKIQDFVALQVGILLVLVCSTAIIVWSLRSYFEGADSNLITSLFIVLLLTISFTSIAIACWTSLPQVTSIIEAREKAEQLFVVALDAIVVLDSEGIICQVNPATQKLFAMTSSQLIGQPLNELLPALTGNPAGWIARSEQTLLQPDHSARIVEVAISQASQRQWLSEYVVILRDMTERKQVEQTLRQAEAQQRAQAQALMVTLQELRQAEAQLVQSEKMSSLGQLVAGVAHEINNPVNFIHGNLTHANLYIQDLLELLYLYQTEYPQPSDEIAAEADRIDLDFLIEDLPKLLASMKVGADRIRDIVRSLRTFSRIDQVEQKAVDLHEGIDSTLMILGNRLKSRPGNADIQIIKDYGEIPPVECYAGQINQVFMNILVNAIDAIEEVGVASEVTTTESAASQSDHAPAIHIRTTVNGSDFVQISIIDNGPGMPEKVRSQLFNPFFTTKPSGKGTGLGLSISYQIVVEKHGGSLRCVSEPGQGTEFQIELPIQRVSQQLPSIE